MSEKNMYWINESNLGEWDHTDNMDKFVEILQGLFNRELPELNIEVGYSHDDYYNKWEHEPDFYDYQYEFEKIWEKAFELYAEWYNQFVLF